MSLFKTRGASRSGALSHRLRALGKFTFRCACVAIAISSACTLILWDANLYAARDRWEHFKLAAFGDWNDTGWCPPGHRADNCRPLTSLEEALARADSLHFFKSKAIEGTGLQVTTGAVFDGTQDIIEGNAAMQWCYVAAGQGALRNHIELGNQLGRDAPVYTRLTELEQAALTPAISDAGFTGAQLQTLSRSHCRFGAFNRATNDPAL
ncbi:MAG: hypothetical protein AAF542_07440 [Pseudomonadota bacterium]